MAAWFVVEKKNRCYRIVISDKPTITSTLTFTSDPLNSSVIEYISCTLCKTHAQVYNGLNNHSVLNLPIVHLLPHPSSQFINYVVMITKDLSQIVIWNHIPASYGILEIVPNTAPHLTDISWTTHGRVLIPSQDHSHYFIRPGDLILHPGRGYRDIPSYREENQIAFAHTNGNIKIYNVHTGLLVKEMKFSLAKKHYPFTVQWFNVFWIHEGFEIVLFSNKDGNITQPIGIGWIGVPFSNGHFPFCTTDGDICVIDIEKAQYIDWGMRLSTEGIRQQRKNGDHLMLMSPDMMVIRENTDLIVFHKVPNSIMSPQVLCKIEGICSQNGFIKMCKKMSQENTKLYAILQMVVETFQNHLNVALLVCEYYF